VFKKVRISRRKLDCPVDDHLGHNGREKQGRPGVQYPGRADTSTRFPAGDPCGWRSSVSFKNLVDDSSDADAALAGLAGAAGVESVDPLAKCIRPEQSWRIKPAPQNTVAPHHIRLWEV
jgi:hypothetical protein